MTSLTPLLCRKLLESGCDINRRTFRGSALHEAVFYGRLDVVAFLLQVGRGFLPVTLSLLTILIGFRPGPIRL